MEKYKAELDILIEDERKKGMPIREFIEEGNPRRSFETDPAAEHQPGVLRGHEGSRLERMLVGGSNDDIIRAMPCSILLV